MNNLTDEVITHEEMTLSKIQQEEFAALIISGCEHVSMKELKARFASLGYTVKSDRCLSMATNMTGPRAGKSYPSDTRQLDETDTNRSAFHVDSRRDENFKRMQELRQLIFSTSRGYIVSV